MSLSVRNVMHFFYCITNKFIYFKEDVQFLKQNSAVIGLILCTIFIFRDKLIYITGAILLYMFSYILSYRISHEE